MSLGFSINTKFAWRLIVLFCSIVSISLVMPKIGIGGSSNSTTSPHSYRPGNVFIPDNGCVPDNETAIRIAEAVWLPIYGDKIYDRKPFRAELISDSIWAVAGSIPSNMLGGVPYIEIQKRDGRILGIGHGE